MTIHRDPASADVSFPQRQVALVDVLDRVLGGGVVIAGDLTLSIAEVDLVRISLRALVASLGAITSGADPAAGANSPGHDQGAGARQGNRIAR